MNNIFIPKRINVGFQNRSSTYTGKLAYVIYYDEKGKLRKQTSWDGWRNHDIPNEEFDNVPTSGFVLNKKVGDYDSGWNHRHAWCRVYDPRNFEFEITIENLLYILENANSIKGKGLEGEFVYGWDGKDLVLVPVESPDYKKIAEYNSIIHENKSIKIKDLIVGATYLDKNNKELIYMGRFDQYEFSWSRKNIKNAVWFAYRDENEWFFDVYRNLSGNKILKCVNENCVDNYSEIYEYMTEKPYFSPIDENAYKYCKYNFEDFKKAIKSITYFKSFFSENFLEYVIYRKQDLLIVSSYSNDFNNDFLNRFEASDEYGYGYYRSVPMDAETLYKKLNPHYREVYLENGKLYEKECYYGAEE